MARLELSDVLLGLFAVQASPLVTGVASVLSQKKTLTLLSVVLCLVAIALITSICTKVEDVSVFDGKLLGYWLAFPSELIFAFGFVLKLGKPQIATGLST